LLEGGAQRAGHRDRQWRAPHGQQTPGDLHSARQPRRNRRFSRHENPARNPARHRASERPGFCRSNRVQRRGPDGARAAESPGGE
jgi:hypothetical protein